MRCQYCVERWDGKRWVFAFHQTGGRAAAEKALRDYAADHGRCRLMNTVTQRPVVYAGVVESSIHPGRMVEPPAFGQLPKAE